MPTTKIKTNIYLDKNLKNQAKKFSKSYGLNFLFKKALDRRKIDLEMKTEPILPGEADYDIAKTAYDNYLKNPEDYVDFDEWKNSLNI